MFHQSNIDQLEPCAIVTENGSSQSNSIFYDFLQVAESDIDFNDHVSNLKYLEWMQQAAIKHSTILGWPPERYREYGYSWFVSSHTIDYLHPSFKGDGIAIVTWVSEMKSRLIKRRTWCIDRSTEKILTRAMTTWVFVNATSGKPCRIANQVRADYQVESCEERVRMLVSEIISGG